MTVVERNRQAREQAAHRAALVEEPEKAERQGKHDRVALIDAEIARLDAEPTIESSTSLRRRRSPTGRRGSPR